MRVLVAEDDVGLRSVLQRGLGRGGYTVDAVGDGRAALQHLRSYQYEVAVIDWRMPLVPGIEVVRETRRLGDRTPILILTARDTTADRVEGLDAGADDYLVKPFEIAELLARLRALQRRPPITLEPVLTLGNLRYDPSVQEVRMGEEALSLTNRELAILELLMRRAPRVVTRRTIVLQVWDDEAEAIGSNTVAVHIARLRSKLADADVEIENVRGVGYRMAAP